MFQIEELQKIAGVDNVLQNEPLSRHTTFRIGGNAKYYVMPQSIDAFSKVISYVREEKEPYYVMGNGSNLLARDDGYDGVIVSTHSLPKKQTDEFLLDSYIFTTTDALKDTEFGILSKYNLSSEKEIVVAGSGVMLSTLANAIAKRSLTGFEFASGIPGTLGGAVTMNAGAYGGEIKDNLIGAMVLLKDGKQSFLTTEELKLGYRTSIIQTEDMLVLWAAFALEQGVISRIEQKMAEFTQKRKEKQPLQYGSAGSTFKRPEGYFAGKLIEDAGLKGYRVGDVMVSEKHCGFVVNVGNGTYQQAMEVIQYVQKTVQEKYGVMLELEVRTIQ